MNWVKALLLLSCLIVECADLVTTNVILNHGLSVSYGNWRAEATKKRSTVLTPAPCNAANQNGVTTMQTFLFYLGLVAAVLAGVDAHPLFCLLV
jgi:hypothetical protein